MKRKRRDRPGLAARQLSEDAIEALAWVPWATPHGVAVLVTDVITEQTPYRSVLELCRMAQGFGDAISADWSPE